MRKFALFVLAAISIGVVTSLLPIDITGNAAVAKIVLDYPQVKFTDYMSLL